jgi:Zn-dependent protease with chaperone function
MTLPQAGAMGKRLEILVIIVVLGCSLRSYAQAQSRDLQKEAAIWTQLESIDPSLLDTFKAATTRMDADDYAGCAPLYQRVVDGAPKFDPAIRRLGLCLFLSGEVEQGLQMADKAVAINRSRENLSSLAQLLIIQPQGKDPPKPITARAFALAIEAQGKPGERDVRDTMLVTYLALKLDKEAEFREATQWLIQEHSELMESHYYNAILAAWDERWTLAEEEIRKAESLGLDPKAVKEFLDSGVHTRATGWRYARYSVYPVVVWALGLLALFVTGKMLSRRVLQSIAMGPAAALDQSELQLRRTYARLIALAGLYYYASLPVVVFLLLAVSGSVLYGFYALCRLPVQLVIALVVMAITSIYLMTKSLLMKHREVDPGRALTREEAPGLWELTAKVADEIGTRPVDEIRITPGTEVAVYERGTRAEKARDKAQRVLILGVGVLNGFRVDAFKAILGHEYGHFSNRDTAGGEIALRVNRDMTVFAQQMITAGQHSPLNLAFQFLRLYHFLFRRISHGASRLQEMMADRVAAMQYGANAFEEGLRHVVRSGVEFVYATHHTTQVALESGAALSNIYDVTLESRTPVEEAVEQALARQTTDDDTHPCPNDRFRFVKEVISVSNPPSTAMVWDLFSDRAALTAEMTALVDSFTRHVPAAATKPPVKTGWLDRCAECGGRILAGGYRDHEARYCSIACFTAGPFDGFCQECTSTTTDDGPGSTSTYNSIGTSLRSSKTRCPKCHSVVTRKWFVVLFLPVIPLRTYRVRWLNYAQYVGRRLKK